jgi:4-hydroxybenzoate-CoA ligase
MEDIGVTYNAAIDMVDRHMAEGRGDKIAFIDDRGSYSYAELGARVNRVANALQALEIDREVRVAMIMLDTIDFPAVFWGAIKAGIVPVCLNSLLTAAQYEAILADCRAQVLFISDALMPTVEPILETLPRLRNVVVSGGTGNGHTALDDLCAVASANFDAVDTAADEIAFWLYSSGSTGMPKGVKHRHTSPIHTARTYGREVLGIREDDVIFSAAKLFFAYGLGNGMSFPLSVGATTVLMAERPTPASVMRVMKQHQPTLFCGVPTLFAALLADPNATPANGSARLRRCISAGEALPEDIGNRFEERFGVEILDGVGSTELLHIFLSNRPGEVRYGTSGVPVPGYEMRLVDEAGRDVAQGEIGELIVDGRSAADGYWNQYEKSRQAFAGRWTYTGDKYFQDEDGFYHYCGRSDDMFKVSGIWVSPFEVESALISHASVLEAAVVPQADDDELLKPKAYVVFRDGVAFDEVLFEALKEHVKAQVGPWKYPRWIEPMTELPKTATGKIQRFKLAGRE